MYKPVIFNVWDDVGEGGECAEWWSGHQVEAQSLVELQKIKTLLKKVEENTKKKGKLKLKQVKVKA